MVSRGTRQLETRDNHSPIEGYPVTDNCFTSGAQGATASSGTSEAVYNVVRTGSDIRVTYVNGYYENVTPPYQDFQNPAALTINAAALNYNGTIYPLSFNGSLSTVLGLGGQIQSDPVPITLVAGTVLRVRTECSSAPSFHGTRQTAPVAAGGLGGFTAGTGLCVPLAGAVAETVSSVLFAPNAVTADRLLVGSSKVVCAIIGDSRGAGANDYSSSRLGRSATIPTLSGGGYIARALFAAGIPSINTAVSSDRAQYANTPYGTWLRWKWLAAASSAICEYGVNDLSTGRTVAQVQADLIALWLECYQRGIRCFQTTIDPITTSTDGWITVANQGLSGQSGNRATLNAWLRDGSPVVSAANLTAAATGSVGSLRAGRPGHPLYGLFDTQVISTQGAGADKWAVLSGRTVTDGAITSGLAVLTSATAAFVAGDVGSVVTIAGAGAAGAALAVTILSITNATTVVVSANAGTTVAGASTAIGVASTKDGIHPNSPMAILMSAAINTSLLV